MRLVVEVPPSQGSVARIVEEAFHTDRFSVAVAKSDVQAALMKFRHSPEPKSSHVVYYAKSQKAASNPAREKDHSLIRSISDDRITKGNHVGRHCYIRFVDRSRGRGGCLGEVPPALETEIADIIAEGRACFTPARAAENAGSIGYGVSVGI